MWWITTTLPWDSASVGLAWYASISSPLPERSVMVPASILSLLMSAPCLHHTAPGVVGAVTLRGAAASRPSASLAARAPGRQPGRSGGGDPDREGLEAG